MVAFLRNQTGSEDLASYRGMIRRSPWMTITLVIFLLSLLGMPPLAGFAAKFQIFRVLFDAGQRHAADAPRLSAILYTLLVIGGLNTVISLVYYIKVAKVMILDMPIEELEGKPSTPLPEPPGTIAFAGLLAAMIFVVGIWWDPLAAASNVGISNFAPLSKPAMPLKTVEK